MAFNYQINLPDTTFYLPSKLAEISGLSLTSSYQELVCIQDEKGKVYFLNKQNGKLIRELKFSGSDDYEGVEVVGDMIYVSNSKGTIDAIDAYDSKQKKTYKTFLNSGHDVEGLGYLPSRHSLLLACKAGSKKKSNRRVYRFDINEEKLDSVPFLVLDNNAINKMLNRASDGPPFAPSGIAAIPGMDQVVIISSRAKAIILMDYSGDLIATANLNPAVHRQPEGLAIDRDGTLYIANEAKDGVAKIHVFKPNKKG